MRAPGTWLRRRTSYERYAATCVIVLCPARAIVRRVAARAEFFSLAALAAPASDFAPIRHPPRLPRLMHPPHSGMAVFTSPGKSAPGRHDSCLAPTTPSRGDNRPRQISLETPASRPQSIIFAGSQTRCVSASSLDVTQLAHGGPDVVALSGRSWFALKPLDSSALLAYGIPRAHAIDSATMSDVGAAWRIKFLVALGICG